MAESLKYRKTTLEGQIESIEKFIKRQERAIKNARKRLKQKKIKQGNAQWQEIIKKLSRLKFVLHQKKRRLRNLRHKLVAMERDIKENKYRICFGGRKLFKAQYNLGGNGYTNHEAWVRDWRETRSSGFFIIGSRDESYGNQSCTYSTDGSLRVRVVNQMTDRYGVYITIPGVVFPYGQEQLDDARNFVIIRGKNGLFRKVYDRAISYRFVKRAGRWYVHASLERDDPAPATRRDNGALGMDLNYGFHVLRNGEVVGVVMRYVAIERPEPRVVGGKLHVPGLPGSDQDGAQPAALLSGEIVSVLGGDQEPVSVQVDGMGLHYGGGQPDADPVAAAHLQGGEKGEALLAFYPGKPEKGYVRGDDHDRQFLT